jgi:hypothetical protein
MLLGAASSYYYYNSYLDRIVSERNSQYTQWLNDQLAEVKTEITALESKVTSVISKPPATAPDTSTPPGKDTTATGKDSGQSPDEKRLNSLVATQQYLQSRLNRQAPEGIDFGPLPSQPNSGGWLNPDARLALGMILVPITTPFIIGLIVFVARQHRRYVLFKRNSQIIGLYYLCQDFLEFIKYQTTLGTGKELGLAYSLFSGKLTSNKQLSDRPLSLPGLTATCTKLLQNIAEVYGNNVVICIDALDKITSIDQLTELLKGVKDILWQENTRFTLTIPVDAMSKFTERLSSDRNLIESSFEETVYLDRVDRRTGMEIVKRSLAAIDVSHEFRHACLLFLIFGAGVPREIKRFMFSCVRTGLTYKKVHFLPFGS